MENHTGLSPIGGSPVWFDAIGLTGFVERMLPFILINTRFVE